MSTANKDCASFGLYESLEFCKGKTVLPGIRQVVYFIPSDQIVSFPTLPDTAAADADMGKIATYEGDFVLAADAKFHKLDVLTTASNITSASQGEKPSKTFVNSSTLKHADTSAKATGFCRMANTDNLIYIVQQRDGQFRVLGNEAFETNTNPSQDSGMNVTDASGTQLEVTVTDVCPAPFYVGKLLTDDGVLDCKTGKLVEEEDDTDNQAD